MGLKEGCQFLEPFEHEDNSAYGVIDTPGGTVEDHRCTHEIKRIEILNCDNCEFYKPRKTK